MASLGEGVAMCMDETAEQVQDKRLSAMLATCLDTSMGTLWKVREDIWKAELSKVVRYVAKRHSHPGLSIRIRPVTSVYERIPMLHGTSGSQGPLVVKGLTRARGPNYPTTFGRIVKPASILGRELVDVADEPPFEVGPHSPLRYRRVLQNGDKPRVSDRELQSLKTWARKKNLI